MTHSVILVVGVIVARESFSQKIIALLMATEAIALINPQNFQSGVPCAIWEIVGDKQETLFGRAKFVYLLQKTFMVEYKFITLLQFMLVFHESVKCLQQKTSICMYRNCTHRSILFLSHSIKPNNVALYFPFQLCVSMKRTIKRRGYSSFVSVCLLVVGGLLRKILSS